MVTPTCRRDRSYCVSSDQELLTSQGSPLPVKLVAFTTGQNSTPQGWPNPWVTARTASTLIFASWSLRLLTTCRAILFGLPVIPNLSPRLKNMGFFYLPQVKQLVVLFANTFFSSWQYKAIYSDYIYFDLIWNDQQTTIYRHRGLGPQSCARGFTQSCSVLINLGLTGCQTDKTKMVN